MASAGSAAVAKEDAFTIEQRSIEYVPLSERRGRVWHQGPFWFMANAELLTLTSGLVGIALGLSLGWSLLAITLGVLFGTFFVAFHAAQGPRLGLPQMIQSRAQFGRYGAVVPSAMVVFLYVGFTVFDAILAGQALDAAFGLGELILVAAVVVLSVVIALVGHDLLHLVQRWLTYIFIASFGVFTIAALFKFGGEPASTTDAGFTWAAFLTQFGVSAAYMLAFAVYVSDYTRYLPPTVSGRATVWWTYLGCAVGGLWLMALGAFLFSRFSDLEPIAMIQAAGDSIFNGFGTFALLISVPGLVSIMAVNIYGAMLTGVTAVDGFKPLRLNVGLRVRGVVLLGLMVLFLSLFLPDDFLGTYTDFVTLLLYFLVPWTAINLVDFYFVRKETYVIEEIVRGEKLYGLWSKAGLIAYFVGFAAMVPFFGTEFFTGPIADLLGGADISFVVGLPVAAALYWLLTRDIDVAAEAEIAAERNAQLDPGAVAAGVGLGPDDEPSAGSEAPLRSG